MKPRNAPMSVLLAIVLALQALPVSATSPAAPNAAANVAFDVYTRSIESRLAAQHASPDRFIVLPVAGLSSNSNALIEHLATLQPSGALIHHWRATQFVPGAKAADLERILRNFGAYPALFTPQVERAVAAQKSQNCLHLAMRVRQHHVLTVVLETAYDVTFSQLDPQHRYSSSVSTAINEVASPGTSTEKALPAGQGHGFLWRQNTYWTSEQRDGGLYIQVESISLTRSIPIGLSWAVGPYIESIPRDSLEFTLHCIALALSHQSPAS